MKGGKFDSFSNNIFLVFSFDSGLNSNVFYLGKNLSLEKFSKNSFLGSSFSFEKEFLEELR
jgi:hypothetical protein